MIKIINHNPYTCPVLMVLQGWIFRQKWHYASSYGWRLMESERSSARCKFPRWLILTECRFWNSKVGVKIRSWLKAK